jgi:hypothetical protein
MGKGTETIQLTSSRIYDYTPRQEQMHVAATIEAIATSDCYSREGEDHGARSNRDICKETVRYYGQ